MAEFTHDGITIAYEIAGSGPPVLLLHGYPQTKAMWRPVVTALSARFTCVTADLRGYGASSKPPANADLANYSFRALARDQRALMTHLGFNRFHLVGHDRGARTAHQLALDASEAIETLTVMDIVPTHFLLSNWGREVATAYYHWTFLAQPAPLPEQMIASDPDAYYESCLVGWGGAHLSDFDEIDSYRQAWRDPATTAGMTNNYRAAMFVDFDLDTAEMDRKVMCPTLVLYGDSGAMARYFDVGAAWKERLADMRVNAIGGGHFFVDQNPAETVRALQDFLT